MEASPPQKITLQDTQQQLVFTPKSKNDVSKSVINYRTPQNQQRQQAPFKIVQSTIKPGQSVMNRSGYPPELRNTERKASNANSFSPMETGNSDVSSNAPRFGVPMGIDEDLLVQAEAEMKNNIFLINLGKLVKISRSNDCNLCEYRTQEGLTGSE